MDNQQKSLEQQHRQSQNQNNLRGSSIQDPRYQNTNQSNSRRQSNRRQSILKASQVGGLAFPSLKYTQMAKQKNKKIINLQLDSPNTRKALQNLGLQKEEMKNKDKKTEHSHVGTIISMFTKKIIMCSNKKQYNLKLKEIITLNKKNVEKRNQKTLYNSQFNKNNSTFRNQSVDSVRIRVKQQEQQRDEQRIKNFFDNYSEKTERKTFKKKSLQKITSNKLVKQLRSQSLYDWKKQADQEYQDQQMKHFLQRYNDKIQIQKPS
ncbi:hypothetical protein PPERSA_08112 [Pseudocohnilembus persalinus]|uniref:Uncharacterized protein n=1 Tax=Pseudocohnilembus persalinus TaxID=266149 RepID=A0A0V0QLD2_PSEPJ|nr:hypothetical protein PPERSA_08112 [Pseudocohnilembus persalinus]|eukprot:KRX03037.1 hypothetical protein PPERSA_08112 [Pseudocohnilembus persalinus]